MKIKSRPRKVKKKDQVKNEGGIWILVARTQRRVGFGSVGLLKLKSCPRASKPDQNPGLATFFIIGKCPGMLYLRSVLGWQGQSNCTFEILVGKRVGRKRVITSTDLDILYPFSLYDYALDTYFLS